MSLEYWVARSSRATTVPLGALLLLRERRRKLAVANAAGKAFHEFGHGVFAVGADQFGEGRKQAGLRQTVAIDAIVPRFRPGFAEIAEGGLLLFVIGQRIAGGWVGHWAVHGTQQAMCAAPGWNASNARGLACRREPPRPLL